MTMKPTYVEAAVALSTHNAGTPGWKDLLPLERIDDAAYGHTRGMDLKELDRIECAAVNVLDALTQGMAAVGDLQWIACENKDSPPEMRTFRQLGVLQNSLAELLEGLHSVQQNASFHLHQRAIREARDAA